MQLRANCKINLGLRVVRKREDGYHELETVMLPVRGLYDVVRVDRSDDDIVSLTTSGIVVDCQADKNIVVRAARLMQERYSVGGVRLHLDKRVPFGAGLGGGSSDATAVIMAINELYGLGLDNPTLTSLAAELGSDTAFFVYNRPQLCTGRGEIMTPVDVDLRGLWLVVVKPDEGVSTAEAYRGVRPRVPEEPLVDVLRRPIEEWQRCIVNDFEPHIFEAHPRIKNIKDMLLRGGALYAAMSGSGSAVFGLFAESPVIDTSDFIHIEQL